MVKCTGGPHIKIKLKQKQIAAKLPLDAINVIVRINNCEPAHEIEEPLAVVVTAERQQHQRHRETQQTSSGVCNAPTGSATTLDAKMSHRCR